MRGGGTRMEGVVKEKNCFKGKTTAFVFNIIEGVISGGWGRVPNWVLRWKRSSMGPITRRQQSYKSVCFTIRDTAGCRGKSHTHTYTHIRTWSHFDTTHLA